MYGRGGRGGGRHGKHHGRGGGRGFHGGRGHRGGHQRGGAGNYDPNAEMYGNGGRMEAGWIGGGQRGGGAENGLHGGEMRSDREEGGFRMGGKPHRGDFEGQDNPYGSRGHRGGGGARPPPGLRGKEIGMWYAARSRGKSESRRFNEELESRTVVSLDKEKEQKLNDLLISLRPPEVAPQPFKRNPDDNDDDGENPDDDKRFIADILSNGSDTNTSDISTRKSDNPLEYHQMMMKDDEATSVMFKFPNRFDSDRHNTQHRSGSYGALAAKHRQHLPEHCATVSCAKGAASGSHSLPNYSKQSIALVDIASDNSDYDCVDSEDDAVCEVKSQGDEGDYDVTTVDDDDDDYDESAGQRASEEKVDDDDLVGFLAEFNQHNRDNARPLAGGRYKQLERDVSLDAALMRELRDKEKSAAYRSMQKLRQRLPSYSMKQEILDCIRVNQVVVISGETGCGKTTQVTQFILDEWMARGDGSLCRVVCTQPRRISAISVAERVADERSETIGRSVGYQIRLEQRLARNQGSILYCTMGILLRWLISDPWLSQTSHVLLDEVHERDTLTDFLMIILRDLTRIRPDLKVVLMSATLNAHMFSTYFNDCAMLQIPGFTFPVQHLYLEDVIESIRYTNQNSGAVRRPGRFSRGRRPGERELEQEYEQWVRNLGQRYSHETRSALASMSYNSQDLDYDLITGVVRHILHTSQDGAILIFVPGWEQIRKTLDSINDQLKFVKDRLRVIPLHSLMPTVNQKEVFDRPPAGIRKIVVATNIAETSITIDDVVYVIDTGKIKMKNFDPATNLSTLEAEWISRANAKQRAGRAGRVQAGVCFHLYTTLHESHLADYQLPEMLRTRLEELCLQIKLLKLGRIEEFISKALQPPSVESLQLAIQHLRVLRALDADESLTALGYHLAKMPVDPQTGKMLLLAALFSCLDPILTVAASLSFKDAFYAPMGQEKIVDARKKELSAGTNSDHLMLVYAYRGWERAKANRSAGEYCRHNYLSQNTLQMLQGMRRQFSGMLYDMHFLSSPDPKSADANVNSANANLVTAVLCAGLYPNVAKIKARFKPGSKRPHSLSTKTERSVSIHPKSVNAAPETQFSSQWLVYHLIMKTVKVYVYDCTSVSPYPLLFFGGDISFRRDLGQSCVVVDNWIAFGASKRTASLVMELRRELDRLLEYKITHPGVIEWKSRQEGELMKAIIDLITTAVDRTPRH